MGVMGADWVYPQLSNANREKPGMGVSEITSGVLAKLSTVLFALMGCYAWWVYRGRAHKCKLRDAVGAAGMVGIYWPLSISRFQMEKMQPPDWLNNGLVGIFLLPLALWSSSFFFMFREHRHHIRAAAKGHDTRKLNDELGDTTRFVRAASPMLVGIHVITFVQLMNNLTDLPALMAGQCQSSDEHYVKCTPASRKRTWLNVYLGLWWVLLTLILDFNAAFCSEDIGRQIRRFYLTKARGGSDAGINADADADADADVGVMACSLDAQAASLLVNDVIDLEEGKPRTSSLVCTTEIMLQLQQQQQHQSSKGSRRQRQQIIPSTFVLISSLQPVPTIDLILFKLNQSGLYRFLGTSAGLLYSYFTLASRAAKSD
eukprot:g2077.t1